MDTCRHDRANPTNARKQFETPVPPPVRLHMAPDSFGSLHHQIEFPPLVVHGDGIAFLGGCEATLRSNAQLLNIGILARCVELALEVVDLFEVCHFSGDEAGHHALLALG